MRPGTNWIRGDRRRRNEVEDGFGGLDRTAKA
jgi:hypothetical protein